MKANHHNKFTQGMIKGIEKNPEYYIPPGADHDRIVAPPLQQSQADQVLKRQTVRQKKSKYQRD
jgi:hypothetical protein